MSRRQNKGRKSRPKTKRHYPRTARLNSLLQQIVADYFERIEDERIDFFTVTGVKVDSDLNKAMVFVSSLDDSAMSEELLPLLADHRVPVQSAIANQTRLRKTPQVVFSFDPAIREGARIESILSGLEDLETEDASTDSDESS